MITINKTFGINKNTSIYDTIKKIEDRLTLLYERRIPQLVNNTNKGSTISQASNINQAGSLRDLHQYSVQKG